MLALLGAAAIAVGLLAPAMGSAAGSNIGAGTADGSVTFDPGHSVPTGIGCGTPSFTLTGTSKASVVANTIIKGYAGQMNLSGSGSSTCENTSGGSGPLTLSVSSTGNSFVNCVNLTGSYSRILTDVSATLGGTCTLNDLPNVPVSLVFHGEFAPTNSGGGVTAPITNATFAGGFVLLPG
jgi:hypothetical protein